MQLLQEVRRVEGGARRRFGCLTTFVNTHGSVKNDATRALFNLRAIERKRPWCLFYTKDTPDKTHREHFGNINAVWGAEHVRLVAFSP